MILSEAKISKLLRGIYKGEINVKNLPVDVYEQTAKYLLSGAYKGFGFDINTAKGEKLLALLDLRDNIYLFSGAKTYQQTSEMTQMIKDTDGIIKSFSSFKNDVMGVYDQYNVDWLKSEYNTAIGQSQMASQWIQIETNKDILPYLTFSTDGHACPECTPFEGLTAPVGSRIWDKCSPLLHYNCMCILIQGDDETALSSKSHIESLSDNIDGISPQFAHNAGKTWEIFNSTHPYFTESPKSLRDKNFDLPIPK